jgi:hypothetical protein
LFLDESSFTCHTHSRNLFNYPPILNEQTGHHQSIEISKDLTETWWKSQRLSWLIRTKLDKIVPNYILFTKVPDLNSQSENIILLARATLWVNKSLTLSISLCRLYWDIKTSKACLACYQVNYWHRRQSAKGCQISTWVWHRRQSTTISLSRYSLIKHQFDVSKHYLFLYNVLSIGYIETKYIKLKTKFQLFCCWHFNIFIHFWKRGKRKLFSLLKTPFSCPPFSKVYKKVIIYTNKKY